MNRSWFVPGTLVIKATNISLISDQPGGVTVNGKSSNGSTGGQVVGAFTVNTGTVTAFKTRGVVAALPTITYRVSPGSGSGSTAVPTSVSVTVPSIEITTVTGSPAVVTFAVLPAALWPLFLLEIPVTVTNNGAFADGKMFVDISGNISLSILAGTAFTVPFSTQADYTFTYLINTV